MDPSRLDITPPPIRQFLLDPIVFFTNLDPVNWVRDTYKNIIDSIEVYSSSSRLAPVLKTIYHQCVISYICSQSYSDGSVLKQSHQSKTGYKYMI